MTAAGSVTVPFLSFRSNAPHAIVIAIVQKPPHELGYKLRKQLYDDADGSGFMPDLYRDFGQTGTHKINMTSQCI